VVQHHHMVPTFYFPCSVSLILVLLFKNKKHANNHKITKTFLQQTLIQKSSDPLFSCFRKSKIAINLNHISSNFFSSMFKNTNKFILPLDFFILNLFFKTNKRHTTNQTSIFTPNYEVLIPHGYVGKGPSPSKSIKL